ncbi:MAG: sigma-70 family RNA polymerase sigma factor [Clostridiales bacterium]|nr:sigma-70 family RNA polymerase sigma factor [Clostridiales bacterium]
METDESLYEHYLNGDDDALRILLERHRDGLVLFLYGIVGNMADAEDLMMDAFATLLAKNKSFCGNASFKTWLFAIARHKAISFLRKQRIATTQLDEAVLADGAADLPLLQAEHRRVLLAAMERLKAEYRYVLLLFYFEDMNCEQIAVVMKITRRKVSDLLYRGKQALKKELEQEGFADAQLG